MAVAEETHEAPPTFDILPLSAEARRAVDDLGYVHPTPVQRAVFEPAIRGKDLVVQARTGTGKTAAFGLPLIDSIVRRATPAVQALVLCPTRELALQVTREVEALAKHKGVKAIPVYGGAPMPKQVQQIRDGAQIVIGTPGRVLDHLRRGTFSAAAVKTLVLDESDEMLSMGFLPQINEILSFMPESRQTLLFSATLPPDIRRMAETKLRNPEFLTLSGDHIGALEIQHFVYMSFGDKISELASIIEIEDPESAIIFCNTRDETTRVAAALEQQGFAAAWLNADLAQNERERVMAATRSSELRFLVATDVAARGIDISHLTHVINFDFPESAEQYVHRTGRTGRAGKMGTAISLVEPSDVGNVYLLRLTYKLRPIERRLPSAREKKTRAEADLVGLFATAFAGRKPHSDDLALARRLLTHENADTIVAGLLRDHLGARPDAVEEATAARRARPPAPAPAPSPARAPAPAPAPVEPRPVPLTQRAHDTTPATHPTPFATEAPRNDDSSERAPADGRGRFEGPRRRRRNRDRDRETPSFDLPSYTESAVDDRQELADWGVSVEPRGDTEPGKDADDNGPSDAESSTPREDFAEIYVNVGRRDGAKPSDFHAVLEARAGLGPDAADYVRVRHRHSFVGTKKDLLDRVLAALNGATIAGKEAVAEIARSRD
jgi:ATP-dependent RNA helicase DeaD